MISKPKHRHKNMLMTLGIALDASARMTSDISIFLGL